MEQEYNASGDWLLEDEIEDKAGIFLGFFTIFLNELRADEESEEAHERFVETQNCRKKTAAVTGRWNDNGMELDSSYAKAGMEQEHMVFEGWFQFLEFVLFFSLFFR